MDTKICTYCKVKKPLTAFSKAKNYKGGRYARCRPCRSTIQQEYVKRVNYRRPPRSRKGQKVCPVKRRDLTLRQRYGISSAEFDAMLARQDGACAICRTREPGGRHGRFFVDHCHVTKTVRGLLCYRCNYFLGLLGDSYQAAKRYFDYLRPHY